MNNKFKEFVETAHKMTKNTNKLQEIVKKLKELEAVAYSEPTDGDPRTLASRSLAKNAAVSQLNALSKEYVQEVFKNTTAVFLNPGHTDYTTLDEFKAKLADKLGSLDLPQNYSRPFIYDMSEPFVVLAKDLSPQIGRDRMLTSHHQFLISNYMSQWGISLDLAELTLPTIVNYALNDSNDLVEACRNAIRSTNGDLLSFLEAENVISKRAVQEKVVTDKWVVFVVGASKAEFESAKQKFCISNVSSLEFSKEPSKVELKNLFNEI